MIFATMGVANAAASTPAPDNPFSVLEAAINDLAAQVAQLFTKTEDLQQQVNNIAAHNTSVIVNNDVPVPNVTIVNDVPDVTVNNAVPVPNVTVTNNMPEPNVTVNVNSKTPEVTVNNNVPVPNVTVTNNIAVAGGSSSNSELYEIYMQVKGQRQGNIGGESTAKEYENWIEAQSYKYNIRRPIDASSGLPTGQLQIGNFIITKELDKASLPLAMALVDNENLEDVGVVLVNKKTGQKYMEYQLHNAIISSIDTAGDSRSGELRPLEEISISYSAIDLIYSQTKNGGDVNIEAGWERSIGP